jgi:hypothetical protein
MTGNTLKDLTAGTAGGIAQASNTCSADDSNAEFFGQGRCSSDNPLTS